MRGNRTPQSCQGGTANWLVVQAHTWLTTDPGIKQDHRSGGAASARKLLNVILCFSAARPHWSVPELCDTLHVSVSTMYRYVALLREVVFSNRQRQQLPPHEAFVALAGRPSRDRPCLKPSRCRS